LFDTVYHRFIDANTAALNNTGYSLLELKQMTPLHLKLNLSENEFTGLIDPLLSGEKGEITFETQHFRKDGSWYEAEVLLQLIADGQEQLFAAIVLDITERKKAETELKKLKDHLEIQVTEKTKELNARIAELEHFYDVTIERELRMEELRNEIKVLKEKLKTSGS
jgi:PAS domain S-box-containing protein